METMTKKDSEKSLSCGQSAVMNIRLSSVLLIASFFVFKLLLDFSYVKVIVPQYGYMGFSLESDPMKIFAGFVLLACLLFILPMKLDTPSSILTFGLFIVTYPATLTMFSYGGASLSFLFVNTSFWLVLLISIRLFPTVTLPSINQRAAKVIFLGVIFAICFYCCFFVIKTFGFNITFNFMGVYDQREAYKQAEIPLSAYLFTWSSNVILPMGFLYLIKLKKYLLSVFPIISILLLYSATGMKSMLFTIPVVLLFAIFLNRKNSSARIMAILVLATAGCLFVFLWLQNILPISLFTRRLFLVPAQISNYYCEFFGAEGQIRLGHSIFSGFVPYRFETEPAKFISRIFVGSDSNFNTGMIADGFANFGYIGVFCWGIILAFVFKLIDSVSRGKDKLVAMGGYIMFLSSLSNSALITNLGTHGIVLSIVMLYLLPLQTERQGARGGRTQGTVLTVPQKNQKG